MPKKHVFIVGPGGVGKTTSGKLLADLLKIPFTDLDSEFMAKIGHIGSYIQQHGYRKYSYLNSDLFSSLLQEASKPSVFVLSSGFLVHEGLDTLIEKNREALKKNGTSVVLLPSDSLEESTEIVVKRQLARGFGLQEERERAKFIHRYTQYKKEGDLQLFSTASPAEIAGEMVSKLKPFLLS